jgi:L-ribulose-5-phosphate 3-epimerase UlaE
VEKMGIGDRRIQLAVYEAYYEDGPIASVRFTEYDNRGSVAHVNQIDYWDEVHMDEQVLAALEAGLDVTVYTKCDIDVFPRISRLSKGV